MDGSITPWKFSTLWYMDDEVEIFVNLVVLNCKEQMKAAVAKEHFAGRESGINIFFECD